MENWYGLGKMFHNKDIIRDQQLKNLIICHKNKDNEHNSDENMK
ncbi:hypothetical protein BH23THE1_BH23THE1_25500 [soil metagenome]